MTVANAERIMSVFRARGVKFVHDEQHLGVYFANQRLLKSVGNEPQAND
jgi:hypothetical protein